MSGREELRCLAPFEGSVISRARPNPTTLKPDKRLHELFRFFLTRRPFGGPPSLLYRAQDRAIVPPVASPSLSDPALPKSRSSSFDSPAQAAPAGWPRAISHTFLPLLGCSEMLTLSPHTSLSAKQDQRLEKRSCFFTRSGAGAKCRTRWECRAPGGSRPTRTDQIQSNE